jgi:hypothetical protein
MMIGIVLVACWAASTASDLSDRVRGGSIRVPLRSEDRRLWPVMFPPGRAKLARVAGAGDGRSRYGASRARKVDTTRLQSGRSSRAGSRRSRSCGQTGPRLSRSPWRSSMSTLGIAEHTYDTLMPMFSDDGRFDPKALAMLSWSFVELKFLSAEPDMSRLYTEEFLSKK